MTTFHQLERNNLLKPCTPSFSDGSSEDLRDSPLRLLAGGNIFKIPLTEFDATAWCCFALMIFFCVLVDRLQCYADYKAGDSLLHQQFLQKVYAELLMFGVVGIVIFMMINAVPELDEKLVTIIHFADMLCSIGACTLILTAFTVASLQSQFQWQWQILGEGMETRTV